MKDNKYRKDTKYWCESCKIFIQNNAIKRKDHEASARHQKAIKRVLDQQYKKKPVQSVSNIKSKPKIKIEDYGFDNQIFSESSNQQQAADFKVTREFEEYNQKIIGTTRIGEWELVEPDEDENKHQNEDVDGGEANHVSLDEKVHIDSNIDLGDDEATSDIEKGFKIIEKTFQKSISDDDDTDIQMKKKTKKVFRKK